MNNTDGTLLSCPNCREADMQKYGQYWSFGSITPRGDIVIMRKGKRFTVIVAEKFNMVCDCGYNIIYSEGVISTSEDRMANHETH